MIAQIRWWPALVVVGGAVALSKIAWSQTMPATSPPVATSTGEQWQTTDRSMLDFLEDGYDLVSVVGSSQTRLYFLSKPGKIVKCREEATLSGPPPVPPPPIRGQAPTFVPDSTVPDTRIDTECAELTRAPTAKQ
jgi:hypothetical protein